MSLDLNNIELKNMTTSPQGAENHHFKYITKHQRNIKSMFVFENQNRHFSRKLNRYEDILNN